MSRTIRAGMVAAAALAFAAPAAHGETIAVAINNVAYVPVSISARVGDTITWTNNDIVAHTATARDKAWDVMIMPNKTQTFVVKKAGAIEYYCRFHPNMVGRIDVKQ